MSIKIYSSTTPRHLEPIITREDGTDDSDSLEISSSDESEDELSEVEDLFFQ